MDGAPDIHQFGWATGAAARLVALAGGSAPILLRAATQRCKGRLLVLASVGTHPLTVLWSVIYFAAGAPLAASAPAVYSLITPMNTALLGWSRNFRLYRLTQLLMFLVLPWLLMMSLGGFRESSVVVIWAALCPLVSLLVEDLPRTVLWIVGFVLLLIVSAILQPYLARSGLPEAFVTWFFALNLGSVIAIVFALLYYFVGQRNFFEERSETLLLNILPKEISEALKTDQERHRCTLWSASVLFADVVGFTPMAATMAPLRLVNLLNDVFHCFDDLVEKHGLEKIKTIGDCYMVASGVPRERPDHAAALVQLAIDMREAVATRRFDDRKLAFRFGINSGPVVAGVIGRKKFIYDLWGAAVNVASRMESQGASGTIQITRSTHDLIEDQFDCESRGTIKVKGADEMEVWSVLGRTAEPPPPDR